MAPKKAKLAAATAEFEDLQAALALKKEILRQVEEKLAGLQDQLRLKGDEKAALEANVIDCENVNTKKPYLKSAIKSSPGSSPHRLLNMLLTTNHFGKVKRQQCHHPCDHRSTSPKCIVDGTVLRLLFTDSHLRRANF